MPAQSTSGGRKAPASPDLEGTATDVAVVPAPDNPSSIFEAVDRADMEIVMSEIAGQMIETMAYEFQMDGKPVRGLSIKGIQEAAREFTARGMGRIDLEMPVFRKTTDGEGEDVYECDIKAVAYTPDGKVPVNAAVGTGEARIFAPKRNGGTYYDKFARRKALSIAQRNAKRDVLPEELKVRMMQSVAAHQLKKVETFRQIAQGQADQKQQQRARGTSAAKPQRQDAGGTPISAGQLRGLFALAKEHGIPNDQDVRWKAICAYYGGSLHADRITKSRNQPVRDALADPEGAIAFIYDRARDGDDDGAKWVIENLLEPKTPGEGQATLAVG